MSSNHTNNIHVFNLQLSFAGKDLIVDSELQLTKNKRYALLGRNVTGKSTLLKMIDTKSLVGFPLHSNVDYLSQEPAPPTGEAANRSALENLLLSVVKKVEKSKLLAESGGEGEDRLLERLDEIEIELNQFSDHQAMKGCTNLLKELGFDNARMNAPVSTLSGGWRMRVELADVLMSKNTDLLLLDEPTNHLDLRAVLFLERCLQEIECTMIIVSHDRMFVDQVATDIIVLGAQKLTPFNGTLSEFEQRNSEKAVAHEHRLDARVRQEETA